MHNEKYAGFWIRMLATLVDFIPITIASAITFSLIPVTLDSSTLIGVILGFFINFAFASIFIIPFWLYKSSTPGKLAFGLTIVDKETEEKPTIKQFIFRFLGYSVSILSFFLGMIWIGIDKNKQGWHDKLSKTAVIKTGGNKKIFVNYRQKISMLQSGRITDTLASHFGLSNIFHDKSTLIGGSNWKEDIENSIEKCSILVVVIGPEWLTLKKPDEDICRIYQPNDYVAMEVSTALERNITVIPVLVDGAQRLQESNLPDKLKKLAFIEPLEIRDNDWTSGINKLINSIYTFTKDPRKLGWRNITSLIMSFIGMMTIADDVVSESSALLGLSVGFLSSIFSLSSYLDFKDISSTARTWSIVALIFSLLVIFIAIDELN